MKISRISPFALAGVVIVSASLGAIGCQDPPNRSAKKQATSASSAKKGAAKKKDEGIADSMLAVFKPALPERMESKDNPITDEKVALGRQLYWDERLSKNHDVSCNSCHMLDKYGVDNEKVSTGHREQAGTRNSPTVYNAALHFVQFWDGRSPNVEHQATQPVLNPVEMAMPDDKRVVETLQSIPEYVQAFKTAFPGEAEPVTLENAGKAIGAFERLLVTPAPWDKFLGGDKSALSKEQQAGFLVFMNNGCTACHMGTLLGGTNYQKLGPVKPWPNQEDQGRFEVTKTESDKMMFKTPSLRNIAKTAPYFHDGSVESLEEAIQAMGSHQLGREISAEDAKAMAVWMESLTGELPAELITKPELPASTSKTPKPDPT